MSSEEYSEMVASLRRIEELLKRVGVSEVEAKQRAKEINEEREKELEILERYEELNLLTLDQEREMLKLRRQIRDLSAQDYVEEERALKVKEKQVKAQEEYNNAIKTMANEFDFVFSTIIGIGDQWKKTTLGKLFQPGGFQALQKSLKKTFTVSNIVGSTVMKIQEQTIELARQQDKALSQFNKSTGALKLYGDQLVQLESDMYRYGVSSADASEVTGALVTNMKGFNRLSSSQQKNLMETTAILNELGVNADLTSGNMETMTRIMGLNANVAAAQSREMFTLAQSLGMPPEEMAEAFRSASPQMAKFGSQGTEVFKKLAVNAREAGMEVEQILGIVEKFDTFEGAADSVGKLNAMLGGPFLNSLEMVKATDPTERMKLLSDAINSTGVSFDQMGYYEKQAIANAAGLKDVSELALVMAGDFDNMTGSVSKTQSEIQDLAKQQKEFNTVVDEFTQIMRMFAISMRPVLSGLKTFMQFIQDVNASTGGYLPHLITLVTGVGALAYGFAQFKKKAGIIPELFDSLSEGIDETGDALEEMGDKVEGKEISFIKLGFAALLVGAGIAIAAIGVSKLALAFSELEGPQIAGAAMAIGLFGTTLIGTLLAMTALSANPLTWAAVGVIIAIGAAAVMMGFAVKIAADSVASLFHSFTMVTPAMLMGIGAGLALIAAGMYSMAATAFILGPFALAMLTLSAALKDMNADSLAPLAAMFVSIDSILSKKMDNLTTTKQAIAEISKSINSIDNAEKVIAVQKVIEAVNVAAGNNRVAAVSGATGGSASSRT